MGKLVLLRIGPHSLNSVLSSLLIFQILEMNPEDDAEEDGANIDLDSQRKGKCVVLKTSTRQVTVTRFFYVIILCSPLFLLSMILRQ